MSRLPVLAMLVAIGALGVISPMARADKTAAELLPASTLVYVEINHPKDLIPLLLDHPLRKEIEQSSSFHEATNKPEFKKLQQVVALIEQRAGVEWRPALEQIAGDQIVIAFEPLTQGVVLLVKPSDMKTAESVRDALFSLPRDEAAQHGKPDPIVVKTYRGLKAYHAGDAIVAELGPWIMASNKKGLAQHVADAFLDGGDALGADEQFSAARHLAAKQDKSPAVWAFARIAPLRLLAHQPWLDPKYKSDNPPAELILGGLMPVAQNAPYVTASFWLDRDTLKLAVAAPFDPAWVPADKKFYFAPPGGGATKPLQPDDVMLSATTYRDISAMWQAGPDLFTEAVATQMAQTDSGLSNLFGGKSFSADVLGAFEPQIQFVAARQDFAGPGPKPSMRLPGAALIFQIKPERFEAVRKHFRVGFQTAIDLGNLDGAQKGRPLLELQTETRGKSEIQYAVYTSDEQPKDAKSTKPPKEDAYLNFSPALAISSNRMILSSTRQLAEQLADLDAKQDREEKIAENTLIQVNAQPVAELIRANREQLIAQNMLEKGHDRAAAEKEIDLLQSIVGYFGDASLRLVPGEGSIRVEAELKTNTSSK